MNESIPEGFCQCGCGRKTAIASQTDTKRGYVRGKPVRYIVGHWRRGRSTVGYKVEDRGYKTPCWIWEGTLSGGYGIKKINQKNNYAHRWFYEEYIGSIPEGKQLDHLCRVRSCCNPDHVEPVEHMVNGQRGGATKLTPEIVRELRELHATGEWTQGALAEKFGLSNTGVAHIIHRRRWENVS